MRLRRIVFLLSFSFLCAFPRPSLSSGARTLTTDFLVLVGYPSKGEGGDSVRIVPGAVIPLEAETGRRADPGALEKTLAHARLVEKLWATFRLDPRRQIQKSASDALAIGVPFELPSIQEASVTINAMLVGYNEKLATYRITFKQRDKTLADSTINVNLGERAVVGGMDGDSAPYLFVVVEPGQLNQMPTAAVKDPVIVSKTNPQYPMEAAKEKISGVVVLAATIDETGKLTGAQALSSPDPRLTEAALASLQQWTFLPARKADGTPIAVRFTISFNFRLQ